MGNIGFNLMDGGPNLFDARFVGTSKFFTQSHVEAGNLCAA